MAMDHILGLSFLKHRPELMFRPASQTGPNLFPFIVLCDDAFNFQYQRLVVLCSCLRKVTESQRSFTKNTDEQLTQIH